MTTTRFTYQNRSSSPRIQRSRSNVPQPQTQAPAPKLSPEQGLSGPAELLQLQGLVGNRALQRMLAGQGIQPKLTVGAANDKYEQEADHVAEQVTAKDSGLATLAQPGAEGLQRQPLANGITPLVQRQTAPEEDEAVQTKRIQRSGAGDSFQTDSAFDSTLAESRGGGSQLPVETRSEMESKFGVDFGGVRVHTGPQATQLSRAVNAEAFTQGQDIYMNKGRFAPETKPGKLLLAHELTHVVQQTGGVQRKQGSISGGMSAARISRKTALRRVDFIKMKRKETHIVKMLLSKVKLAKKPDDAYGHWWTELGAYNKDGDWTPTESYGWWPSRGVDIKDTLSGVPGRLNGKAGGSGTATRDPHHGEAASEFNPAMQVDDSVDPAAFRKETMQKVRNFATSFKGSWNWRLGWGKNCHTFQERMMKALGMKKANGAVKMDTGDFETHNAADNAERSLEAWGKIKAAFEEYDGLQFLTLDTIKDSKKLDDDDFYSALADCTPEEQAARIKEIVDHGTGVIEMDIQHYKTRP